MFFDLDLTLRAAVARAREIEHALTTEDEQH